jgi:hypothetical protein
MRAKVSLSLTLAADPQLLVLDEPTSGLDAMVRREFLESMVDLASSGRTVLLSSHQIGEVERVASRVALLHQGRLILAEPLDELKARTFLLALTFTSRDHPAAPTANLPVELIDAADAPRQAHWLVRDRAAAEAVRTLPGVDSLQIETPTDPYTPGRHFGYVRSSGQALLPLGELGSLRPGSEDLKRLRPTPGSWLLYGVGPDRQDDGARTNEMSTRSGDLVFPLAESTTGAQGSSPH